MIFPVKMRLRDLHIILIRAQLKPRITYITTECLFTQFTDVRLLDSITVYSILVTA